MALLNELELLGADANDALQRLGGKVSFYEKLLLKLPNAIESNQVVSLIEEGNITQAIANAHTLKGVFGNLSITPLYKTYTEIVDELRAGHVDAAKDLLVQILPLQEQVLECIKKHQ